jgi:carbon storage regulator CsrA
MLVIARKRSERILITTPDGYEIVVMICQVKGGLVKVGLDACKEVKILRAELVDDGKSTER